EFGITAEVEEVREVPDRDGSTPVPPGVLFRLHRVGTEDIAHATCPGLFFRERRNPDGWFLAKGLPGEGKP
ncbi:MAG: hypothetical protein RMM10_13300, partial [Anaerolineae bacterium]|nr:hypothetical protein [Thermoflexus sp.]MDW8181922.1 hypothetical protein [Anaerolineae bacterium]